MKATLPLLTAAMILGGHHATGLAQHDHGAPARSAAGDKPAKPQGMREWTKHPLLLGRAERSERSGAVLTLSNLAAGTVTVHAAEGPPARLKQDYPVTPEGVRITSVTPKIGNYHWVVAREETPDMVRVASTAWYFGNPGESPKDLLTMAKHELEIVPAPLPREHRSYREAEKWQFLVRFEGQPLPNQRLIFETEFGSRSSVVTDAQGLATLVFPRDFKPSVGAAGEQNASRQRSRFVLATEKEKDGRRYQTAFNYTYSPDPERNRSLAWGAGFGILGMLAATPLLRRRKITGGNDHHA